MHPEITQDMLNEVYADRNRLVLLVATLADMVGMNAIVTEVIDDDDTIP